MVRFVRTTVALAAAVLFASACVPPPPAPPPEGFDQLYLTRDGADHFVFQLAENSLTVTSPASNRGSNSRALLWRVDAPQTVDQQSCATFTDSGLPNQEGVVLRVRTDHGVGRGITVTKNIWYGYTHAFNVHVWDTSRPADAGLLTKVSGHFMTEALGPYPWRLCARAVGARVTFKVWPASQPTPAWDDPIHARSTTLPPGRTAPGRPGIYVGHVPAGGRVGFSDLSTSPPG